MVMWLLGVADLQASLQLRNWDCDFDAKSVRNKLALLAKFMRFKIFCSFFVKIGNIFGSFKRSKFLCKGVAVVVVSTSFTRSFRSSGVNLASINGTPTG